MIAKSKDTVFKRRMAALAVLLILLITGATVPFPQTTRGPCRIELSAVWSVKHLGAGEITAGWDKNLFSAPEPRLLMNFDRPDLVEIQVNEKLVEGGLVNAGDTVAIVTSREVSGRLRVIEAEVAHARAEKEALRTGGRSVDLEVERRRSLRAEASLNAFRSEYERVKALYEKDAAPLSLWQQTEGQLRVLQTELDLANARVKTVEAGAKPADIQVAQAEVLRLERELERVSRTLGFSEILTAPVSGRISFRGEPGTVLTIEREDTLLAFAAIPEGVAQDLTVGQPMQISLLSRRDMLINTHLESIGFDTTGAYVTAFVNNKEGLFQAGMMGAARLKRGNHTIFDGFKTMLSGQKSN
ncbi:MAG: hypothetical protein P9L92_09375 [Candidatus Electryonea clarkiae]|nr:hypothetical protein [Candidatus Electryonea clarkiae]MDP8288147.1 hypothetical protein [Candidatus Electryonea clarkiae]